MNESDKMKIFEMLQLIIGILNGYDANVKKDIIAYITLTIKCFT